MELALWVRFVDCGWTAEPTIWVVRGPWRSAFMPGASPGISVGCCRGDRFTVGLKGDPIEIFLQSGTNWLVKERAVRYVSHIHDSPARLVGDRSARTARTGRRRVKYTAPRIEARSEVKGLMFWNKKDDGCFPGGYT